jgi:hypothetical protein
VWLATLSTVVGIATGMFTLRDQIFPGENGVALSAPAYQAEVARLCDAYNTVEARRARQLRALRREVRVAPTAQAQRDAILRQTRDATTRSGHVLAELLALDTPRSFVAAQRGVARVWNRILELRRGYQSRLLVASSRDDILAAAAPLNARRGDVQRAYMSLTTGLDRLGGSGCRVDAPSDLPVPLPVDRATRAQEHRPQAARRPRRQHRAAQGPDVGSASGATGRVAAPSSAAGTPTGQPASAPRKPDVGGATGRRRRVGTKGSGRVRTSSDVSSAAGSGSG